MTPRDAARNFGSVTPAGDWGEERERKRRDYGLEVKYRSLCLRGTKAVGSTSLRRWSKGVALLTGWSVERGERERGDGGSTCATCTRSSGYGFAMVLAGVDRWPLERG